MSLSKRSIVLGCLMAVAAFGSAAADVIAYPDAGTANRATYRFTAPSTGEIRAYVYATASVNFTDTLGLRVDGVDTMKRGPNNKDAVGTYADLGFARKGATLLFLLDVAGLANQPYTSDPAENDGGTNLLFAAPFAGGNGLPAGTYLGWEDLDPSNNPPLYTSDFNYTDAQFVITSVAVVPLPGSAPMLGAALATLGLLRRVMRRRTATA